MNEHEAACEDLRNDKNKIHEVELSSKALLQRRVRLPVNGANGK